MRRYPCRSSKRRDNWLGTVNRSVSNDKTEDAKFLVVIPTGDEHRLWFDADALKPPRLIQVAGRTVGCDDR